MSTVAQIQIPQGSGIPPVSSSGSPRNIAAPYQTQTTTSPMKGVIAGTPPRSLPTHLAPGNKVDTVDYRSFQFQELESAQVVAFDKYCGPTPESNWVVPGKLLVGAYPASNDDGETLDLITSILRWGITKFVCLQQEYREHGVTEQMWRSGQALRPYFHDVRSIVKKKALLPTLRNYPVVDESNLSFVHFPIRDCGITDDDRVLELARALVKSIAEGEIIYLHCWGGHGRTGTLVCIMLHLMYGYTDVDAMQYCQAVHDLRQCPVVVGSPQTQTQRDQVSRVIQRLITQSRFSSRTMSGDESMLAPGTQVSSGPALQMNQTLSSTLSSPRADPLSASGNQATAMATTPTSDNNNSANSPEGATMEGNTSSGSPEQTVNEAVEGTETDDVSATPAQAVTHASPGEREENSTSCLEDTGSTNETGDMVMATVEKNVAEIDGESRMRLASDCDIQVDLSTLRDDTEEITEEVRNAEEITTVHPPEQVKPSFTFSRKGMATTNQ